MKFFIKYFAVVLVFSVFFACSSKPKIGKLGIEVSVGDGVVTKSEPYRIVGVYKGTPSHIAGVLPDDIIVQVNGIRLLGKQHEYIFRKLLQGPPGKAVTLVIKRGKDTIVTNIVRGR